MPLPVDLYTQNIAKGRTFYLGHQESLYERIPSTFLRLNYTFPETPEVKHYDVGPFALVYPFGKRYPMRQIPWGYYHRPDVMVRLGLQRKAE
jgi:hypothetical protein